MMIVLVFSLIVNVQIIPSFDKEEILSMKVYILPVVCCVLFFPVLRKQPPKLQFERLTAVTLVWKEN